MGKVFENAEIITQLLDLIEIQLNVLDEYVSEDPMAADICRDLRKMKQLVEYITL